MKSIILLLLFLSAFCKITSAQKFEFGLFGGSSYYIGDLSPSQHFLFTKPAGGFLYRYNINPRFSFKLNAFYGTLEARDDISRANIKRNLSFKSSILDFAAEIELNFFKYKTGDEKMFVSPYIFAGIAVFSFNPKAKYLGKWYDLQPLGTEGQGTSLYPERKPYSLISVSFPFGMGIKRSITKNICCGAEWGLRKTNTDYIDDVSKTYADPKILNAEHAPISATLADRSLNQSQSHTNLQRGNPSTKDWYSFAGIFVTISIKKKTTCGNLDKPKRYRK